jgi:diguanylate cyclase (GGDEF)-like protein/PAS domain S-box-containing protein
VTRWLGSVSDVTDKVESRVKLQESEQRYRSVVATMAEGVVLQDAEGQIVTANDAACRVLDLNLDQLLGGRSIDPRWRAVREDGSPFPVEERPAVRALASGAAVRDVTMGVYRPDGSVVWLEVAAEPLLEPLPDGTQEVRGVVTTFSNVTAARAASRALARSEQQFRSAMAHAPVGMALVGLDGSFVEVNRALCRLVGYDEADLIGSTFQRITHPDDLDADLENLARLRAGDIDHYTMEKRYITPDGEVVWVLLAVSLAHDDEDEPAHYVAQMQDITASRAAQEVLTHRALHDPLTGLANRDLLMDRLAHALSRSARSTRATVVLFCDLDHFKDVNDGLGHETGDLVLVTIAERLTSLVRPSDTVARLGGDEFVIVAEGLDSSAAQRSFADRVRAALHEPVRVAGSVVRTGASIGVAVSRPEDDARSLLREADAAMYRAKARGRGRYEVSDAVRELGPIGS